MRKRLVCFLLALSMLLSMMSTALAVDDSDGRAVLEASIESALLNGEGEDDAQSIDSENENQPQPADDADRIEPELDGSGDETKPRPADIADMTGPQSIASYADDVVSGFGGVTEDPSAYRASVNPCENDEHNFKLVSRDSEEATDRRGGYRHYQCEACGMEYAYTTDPLIYAGTATGNAGATNPYLPLWEHFPDGDPHVFWSKDEGEWRVYIYGTHDVDLGDNGDKYGISSGSGPNFCSDHYICWSAPVYDLSDWQYEGRLWSLDQVTEPLMMQKTAASDCGYNLQNDKYYFAACLPMGGTRLLESDSPCNPFEKEVYRNSCFDPSVYIKEDGTIYIASCSGIDKLRAATDDERAENDGREMVLDKTYALSTADGSVLPYLYEASSIRYLAEYGMYIYIWSSKTNPDDENEHATMSYAYARDIEDEKWTYGGVFSDASGRYSRNPATGRIEYSETPTYPYGNNHGGIVNANGQWYYFGHRQTGKTEYRRQGWIEKINIQYIGNQIIIEPHELTSSGAADYLDAYADIPAGIVCYLTPAENHEPAVSTINNNAYVDVVVEGPDDRHDPHGSPIVNIKNGVVAGYKYLKFSEDEISSERVQLTVLVTQETGYADGTMDVYLDAPTATAGGTKIGSIAITAEAIRAASIKDDVWSELSATMDEPVSGTHGVYFVFSSGSSDTPICKLDEFTFEKVEAGTNYDPDYRACEHVTSYRLQSDSHEATDTVGGYRHYKCSVCGAEYSYETDPMVYRNADGSLKTAENAINPYLPNWEFMPDNELHVFWSRKDSEWRVYAVGSHDKKLSGWCGDDITCWSAPVYDLTDWRYEAALRDTGTFFACDFNYDLQTDQVVLYAFPFFGNPEINGRHLWVNGHSVPDSYFDLPLTEGDGVVGLDGENRFDPAIYITEDGTILAVYDQTTDGTKHAQLAKVNPNDRTKVEWTSDIQMAAGEQNNDGFNPKHYEGSSIDLVEVGSEKYWVIQYSYKSNRSDDDYEKDVDGDHNWWPLAYIYVKWDSNNIDDLQNAKWHWGGLIGDNGGFFRKDAGSDEVTDHGTPVICWGNNHGGLAYINGEWYISNHRHTSTGAGRQGFIEKVSISASDGKLNIGMVEYTSSINESIDAYHTWPAYIACHLWPTVYSESTVSEGVSKTLYIDTPLRDAPDTYWSEVYKPGMAGTYKGDDLYSDASPIVGIKDGVEVGFKYLDFGENAANVKLEVLAAQESSYVNGTLNVYIDAPSAAEGGTQIGSIAVNTAKDGRWTVLSSTMDKTVQGVHGVYFVFTAADTDSTICKLNEFTFRKISTDISYDPAYRACEHVTSYVLQSDSYEATDTMGGYRHYKCSVCGEEYSYTTAAMLYKNADGSLKAAENATNPYLPNWEFMPDNELHVFWSRKDNEWRVYAVGSHDKKLSGWCGNDVQCWSAPVYDLSDWRFECIICSVDPNSTTTNGRQPSYAACDFAYDLLTDQIVFIANITQPHVLYVNGRSVPDSEFNINFSEEGVRDVDSIAGGESAGFDPAIYINDDPRVGEIGDVLLTFDYRDDAGKHLRLNKLNEERTAIEKTSDVKMAAGEPQMPSGYNPKHFEASTIDRVIVDGKSFWVLQYSLRSDWQGDLDEDVVEYEIKDEDGNVQKWWPLVYIYSEPDLTIDQLFEESNRWYYGGVIGENAGYYRVDANGNMVIDDSFIYSGGNNHGGLAQINGKWYVSNHRHTSDGAGRQGYLREVNVTTNGSKLVITPPEYTSSIYESIDAYKAYPAYIACHLLPNIFSEDRGKNPEYDVYIESALRDAPNTNDLDGTYWSEVYNKNTDGSYKGNRLYAYSSPIVGIKNGVEVGFKYLDFGGTSTRLELKMLVAKEAGYTDGTVDIYIDAPSIADGGIKIGSLNLSNSVVDASTDTLTANGITWKYISNKMNTQVSGKHAVYFVFNASDSDSTICKFNEFQFSRSSGGSSSGNRPGNSGGSSSSGGSGGSGSSSTPNNPGNPAENNMPDTTTPAPTPAPSTINPFTDVTQSQYYFDAVQWAVSQGVTSGTSATTFSPNDPCTRAQIVTFLWRAAGSPSVSGSNPFTDVAQGSYYYDAVQWAVAQGITSGTTDTTFSPNVACTRAQAVTFLYRVNGSPAVSGTNSFTDVANSAYYVDAVQWAVNNGVTSGTSATTFSPNMDCTRAQIVTFLYRGQTN